MVPRVFLFNSTSSEKTANHPATRSHASNLADDALFPSHDTDSLRLPGAVDSGTTNTSPVVVPPKCIPRATPICQEAAGNGKQTTRGSRTLSRRSSAAVNDRPLSNSIASVLEATAIPVPRRNWAGSRRLPQRSRAEDFSKFVLEGANLRGDQLADAPSNTALDILLSPPEENDKQSTGNDCDTETPPASLHSISTESTPSLEHDLDSQSSVPLSSPPSSQRSHPERRGRKPSHSENCASDHPLLEAEAPGTRLDPVVYDPPGSDINARKPSSAPRSSPGLGSSFKSNLTASLRAIKSAAQTVSTFATPPIHQDDFLTRSLFTITPKLTDDRRPPPMNEPPSPALRRYLNPITVSPAEMHIYNEHPPESSETTGNTCPVSIQMQTYQPSGTRGRRKAGFHFSAIDGDLPYGPEMVPTARQREPRENSDFLRMVVLEMNMRRNGKLRDDIPTRAQIWRPPRKNGPHHLVAFGDCGGGDGAVPLRWVGVSVECGDWAR
ncbi:hypothetical protein PHISP_00399 [Aspergillus sp. HF37]|nr:hypothetical protein PHISP_00399 [Aspergillus sp. HF37]